MATRVYGVYLGDLNRASNQSQGIINYSVGLAIALSKILDPSEALIVYANEAIAEELHDLDLGRTQIHLVKQPANYARRLLLDSRAAWIARRHGLDVLHFPKGILPLFTPPSGPRLVTTIHDDIPMQYSGGEITRGDLRSRVRARLIATLFMRSLRKSDFVVTISEHSRRSLEARLRAGRTATKNHDPEIRVVASGTPLPDRPYVAKSERSPALVHLASPLPHKQSAFTIASTLRYLDERAEELRLVIVGRPPAEVALHDPRIEHHRGYIANDAMAALLANARALLFPSRTEGFGLPPVEAWRFGTPSIYCSAPAIEEMDRAIPGHLSETSYDAFAAALDEILALDDAELLDVRAAVSAVTSWEKVAREILDIYREQSEHAQV